MKKDPPGVFFGVFRLSKHENTNEHVLVQACKIHESVLYQAFLCLFFELSKNEDGPKFALLDSLEQWNLVVRYSNPTIILIMNVNNNNILDDLIITREARIIGFERVN